MRIKQAFLFLIRVVCELKNESRRNTRTTSGIAVWAPCPGHLASGVCPGLQMTSVQDKRPTRRSRAPSCVLCRFQPRMFVLQILTAHFRFKTGSKLWLLQFPRSWLSTLPKGPRFLEGVIYLIDNNFHHNSTAATSVVLFAAIPNTTACCLFLCVLIRLQSWSSTYFPLPSSLNDLPPGCVH